MAHFAELDENNIVLRVLVVPDDQEHRGHEFMADDLALGGTWIQTSYNTHGGVHHEQIKYTRDPIGDEVGPQPGNGTYGVPDGGIPLRYNFASTGSTYDPVADAFYHPQPFPSWALDENFVWQPPTPYPSGPLEDLASYFWDENTTSWVEVED